MRGRTALSSSVFVVIVALTSTVMAFAAAGLLLVEAGWTHARRATSAGAAADIRDGQQLLRAMHDRYAQDWYETLSFQQDAITHNEDGTTKKEIWYEAAMLPGRLRIDIGNEPGASGVPKPEDSHGMLVANNTIILFKNGEVTSERPFVHMLLVLGFDVYKQPPETTIAVVKEQGYDLSKVHQENFNGEPMFVVGAEQGDLKTKQFWVEQKRLLFVRLIKPDDQEPAKSDDERFLDYRKMPVGWVSARVEFYKDGRMEFHEVYANIQANPKLDAAMFDPRRLKARAK